MLYGEVRIAEEVAVTLETEAPHFQLWGQKR